MLWFYIVCAAVLLYLAPFFTIGAVVLLGLELCYIGEELPPLWHVQGLLAVGYAWFFFSWMLKRKTNRVAEESAEMMPEAEPDTPTAKKCATCHLVIPATAKFCLECGASQIPKTEAIAKCSRKQEGFLWLKVLEVHTTYLGGAPMKKVLVSGLLVLVVLSCVIGGMYTRVARYANAKGNALDAAHHNPIGWYQLSALMGSGEAMYNLGISYYYGTGVPKDHSKAAQWFEKAALSGVPDGMYVFGHACLRGDGVSKDEAKGVQWEVKAADAGSSDALYNMAVWHRDGIRGFPKDEVKALAFAEKAAMGGDGCNDGNQKALQYLADKYRPKEPWKAYRWEQMLADKGNHGAMLRVAKANILYEDSFFSLVGSPRDLAKASHYLDEVDAHRSDMEAWMGEYVDFLKSRLNSAAAATQANANSAGALSDFNQFRADANATTPTPSAAREPELVIETADLSHEHLGSGWSSAQIVVSNKSDRTLSWVIVEYSVYDQSGTIIGQASFQFTTLPPHARASQKSGLYDGAARVVTGEVRYQ